MIEQGTISITLDGITYRQTERCRSIIHTLFEQGLFNVKNGSVILHFDHEGILQEIEVHVKKWRRNRPEPSLYQLYKNAKIEFTHPQTTLTQTSSGQPK